MTIAWGTITLVAVISLFSEKPAAYSLIDNYDSSNWMSMFTVQSITDPTHGYVSYVTEAQAQSRGIYQVQGNQVYIGVDHMNTLNTSSTGRESVRLQSNKDYTHALVIGDFSHVPGTECGSWPAFWMVGANWPKDGEIDIIEGVNLIASNTMTLHTAAGCNVSIGPGGQSGTSGTTGCGDGGGYNGCGVTSTVSTSYGTPFNNVGGGVYAMEWTASGIDIWYWPQGQVPGEISAGNPDPNGWGTPQANFGGCNFDQYFANQFILFDITFCGDWAGQVWNNYPACAAANASCEGWVAANPKAYSDTYWLVHSVKVYQ